MNGTSEVPAMLNKGVRKMTKSNCTSIRCMHYEKLTPSSLGLAEEHYLIQIPRHRNQAVLEREGCFHYLETFQSFEDKSIS